MYKIDNILTVGWAIGPQMLQKWMMTEKGALPSLIKLQIGPCPLLKEIRIRIKYLGNLKRLIFNMMLNVVCCMIKMTNGKWLPNTFQRYD